MADTNPKKWQRKSRITKYENPWIKVDHDEVINPNGGNGIYGVVHFKNLAIGIVPIDEEGNTWLVGQHRYPLDKFTWEIPEGGGLRSIDPLVSAQRELQEEVGLIASDWKEILRSDLSNSATDESCVIYLARGLQEVGQSLDETEDIKVKKVALSEAIAMVDTGEITDSLSVLALLWIDRERLKQSL